MDLGILGIGTVSALGCGVTTLAAALCGDTRPAAEIQTVQSARGPINIPVLTATPDGLDRFIPKRALRRVDKFSRMALLAASLALEDAGLAIADRSRLGIVFGTGYGPLATTFEFQDTILRDGDRGASPTAFAGSVHNAPASQVAIQLQFEGPCQTLTTFDHTAAGVLATAAAWLREGRADAVLACLGDEFHPLAAYALAGMGVELDCEPAPLDFGRCTVRPGEMCTAFLLARPMDHAPKYGRIGAVHNFENPADPRAREFVATHDGMVLGAAGRRSDRACAALRLEGLPVAIYSTLYGGSPVMLGMDLAAAALGIRDGVLYPSPPEIFCSGPRVSQGSAPASGWNLPREPFTLPEGGVLVCAACAEDGSSTLISLK